MAQPRLCLAARSAFVIPARARAVTLAALAATAALAAAGCKPGGGGNTGRTLSCAYDYENERFGGLLYDLDLADSTGHFDHVYAGGPVESVTGEFDLVNREYTFVETYRAGYATVTRVVTGPYQFEDDGDGTWSSAVMATMADGTVKTSNADSTRTGCVTTTSRTDDEDTVSDTTAEMVSITEATFETVATRADGTVITTTGSAYLDWTGVAHVERDDPLIAQDPDYIEDRSAAADGSATGTFVAWYQNGVYETGSTVYSANGDATRTFTRYEDDTMAVIAATGTATTYQDGSGTATFTFTDMMGMAVTCTRDWTPEMAMCSQSCDNGTTPPC